MQRLALVTAYEALESSGYVHGRGIHQRRVGTFYGCASDDYREVNTGQDIGTTMEPISLMADVEHSVLAASLIS